MSKKGTIPTKTIAFCAIFTALGVIVARFLSIAPNDSTRFSFEAVPIFLSGVLFGPLAGAMVGFATDFIGCLFSPYGFNPLLCLPPVLYGLCGGIFRGFLSKSASLPRILIAYFPAVTLGSILWQSYALSIVSGKGFLFFLGTRSIQFAVMLVLDTLITWALLKSRMFHAAGLLKPKKEDTV